MSQANVKLIHEESDLKEQLIRQDRIEAPNEESYLVISGKSYEVANYSSFGVAIFVGDHPNNFKLNIRGEFIFADTHIGHFNLQHIWDKKISEERYKIAFEIEDDVLSIDKIKAVTLAKDVIHKQAQGYKQYSDIPAPFRSKVLIMKDRLANFRHDLNAIENKMVHFTEEKRKEFEDVFCETIGAYLTEIFNPFYNEIRDLIESMEEDMVNTCFKYFRHELLSFLHESPFARLSFEKPRGYPGDFEILDLIYKNEPVGRDLFSKSMHRHFITHQNAQAVRNRIEFLQEKIIGVIENANGPVNILSVASGAARELQDLIANHSDLGDKEINFYLLDQDVDSLKYTQQKLRNIIKANKSTIKVNFIQMPIRKLIRNGIQNKTFDLIYSAGMFDYFSDPVAQIAASKLYHSLKRGGQLVIGNFTAVSLNEIEMVLALDWRLIYRNQNDLMNMYDAIPGKKHVESEPENINLFIVIEKENS